MQSRLLFTVHTLELCYARSYYGIMYLFHFYLYKTSINFSGTQLYSCGYVIIWVLSKANISSKNQYQTHGMCPIVNV
jgi:hypothetical protein